MTEVRDMILLWFVVVAGTLFVFVHVHEAEHAAVNNMFGLESNISYSWFGMAGETRTLGNVNPDYYTEWATAQAKVEIEGYNLSVMIMTFYLGVFIISATLLDRSETNES